MFGVNKIIFLLSIESEIRIDLQHLERCLIKMIPLRAASDGIAAIAIEKEQTGKRQQLDVAYFYSALLLQVGVISVVVQFPLVCLHHTPSPRQSHCLAVKRLRWRPRPGRAGQQNSGKDGQPDVEEESSWLQLASASADHSVKIFNVNRRAL